MSFACEVCGSIKVQTDFLDGRKSLAQSSLNDINRIVRRIEELEEVKEENERIKFSIGAKILSENSEVGHMKAAYFQLLDKRNKLRAAYHEGMLFRCCCVCVCQN
jgi:hypothetical protein